MTEYKLKMLFHCGFYDVPINGLAVYNDEEVYFYQQDNERFVTKEEYTPAILTKIDEFRNAEDPDTVDDRVGPYSVFYDNGEVDVERILTYDIYRLPHDILQRYKASFIEASENVGYHCWHDPQYYNPTIKSNYLDYYKRADKIAIPIININNLEHLGTFRCDEFQYFNRPY